jgi:hypothetical protein
MKIGTPKHESALNEVPRYPRLQGLWLDRIGVLALVALIGFAFSEPACAKPAAPDLKITVRVYNYSQTPSTMLAEAEREAGRILGEAGLMSVWLDCPLVPTDSSQNPCPEPIEAADIRLRVFSEAVRNSLHDNAYGFAIMPALASVYSESVLRFARNDEGDFEAPIVLGCAMAHEIGHLLLGSNSHSISGVMCAHWQRKHVRQALMGALLFSSDESRLMRAEMRKRITPSASYRKHTTAIPSAITGDQSVSFALTPSQWLWGNAA